MFKWFIKLFRKKEERLVAILSHEYSVGSYYYHWYYTNCTHYCYENEDGVRRFETSYEKSGHAWFQDINKLSHYHLLEGWQKHTHNLYDIPTFDQINGGTAIVKKDV